MNHLQSNNKNILKIFLLLFYYAKAFDLVLQLSYAGSYHGAAERPEPPQQSDGEQKQQDEQRDSHYGPIRLQPKHYMVPTFSNQYSLCTELMKIQIKAEK